MSDFAEIRPRETTDAFLVFDAVVPGPWNRSHHLTITGDAVVWNGRRASFVEIESVAYRARPKAFNLFREGIRRDVILTTATDRLDLWLDDGGWAGDDLGLAGYATLIDTLHREVEPRLVAQHLQWVLQGEMLSFGDLSISAVGIHLHHRLRRDEVVPWHAWPSAELDGEAVVVVARTGDRTRRVGAVSMLEPNAVLLPEILDALRG